jgi:L-alanine-DL-glutamate epimerase-like enolase superfamily enzyme
MTGPGAGLVVRDVTVRSVVVPLRRPLATRVGDFARWPLLLIDVTTEQGVVGRGYLAHGAGAGLQQQWAGTHPPGRRR